MLVTRQDDHDFVKVLDFGFAKIVSGMPEPGRGGPAHVLSRRGRLYGTPSYMAPEQCVEGAIDARTDLYALGLILYEMLTGESPFGHGNLLKIIRHQLSTPTPPMSTMRPGVSIPASLEAVVMRLTEKPPDARYASATEVIAVLHEVAKQEGIHLSEPSIQFPAPPSQSASAGMDSISARKPYGEAVPRPDMAAPPFKSPSNAANPDQKTAVLPMGLQAADARSLSHRIKERLPASLQMVPLPLILLAPASLLALLLVLLLR